MSNPARKELVCRLDINIDRIVDLRNKLQRGNPGPRAAGAITRHIEKRWESIVWLRKQIALLDRGMSMDIEVTISKLGMEDTP